MAYIHRPFREVLDKTPLILEACLSSFLRMDFVLSSFPIFYFLLAIVCLIYYSKITCLVSSSFRHFLANILFSGVGTIIYKILVFTALNFALVLVEGPAYFKSDFNWITHDAIVLWFSDRIA